MRIDRFPVSSRGSCLVLANLGCCDAEILTSSELTDGVPAYLKLLKIGCEIRNLKIFYI